MEQPNNILAEQAVLGAMLENDSFRIDCLSALDVNDFYEEHLANRDIFTAINNLVSDGKQVDVTNLTEELLNHLKTFERDGGIDFIVSLKESYLGEKYARQHLEIVKDLSLLRKFLNVLSSISNDYNKSQIKSIPDFIALSEKRILDITKSRRVGSFRSSAEVVDVVTTKIKLSQGKKSSSYVTGVDTGFNQMNKLTQGFQPGEFIILAARPSVGKTALAINLAYNAASLSHKTVAFFSLEMAAEDIVKRLLASRAQINSRDLSLGTLNENDWLALSEAVDAIKETKILIDDTSGARLADIVAKSEKLKAQDENLGLIVIDYLGLITTGNTNLDQHQLEVAEISRSLKKLARDLSVPILCLCQLSRASEKRTDRTPIMSDIRDSGGIEQDADKIMFIYRPNYQRPEEMRKAAQNQDDDGPFAKCEETHVLISKNRNGATGIVYLNFLMNIGKFIEMDPPKTGGEE